MISSMGNARVKRIVALQGKSRERARERVFVAEGKKMFMEAPLSWLREIYVSEDMEEDGELSDKLADCRHGGIAVETVSGEVFRKMSDTSAPQGILCVAGQPSYDKEKMIERALFRKREEGRDPLFLILEDIQDPGNLGTMVRTAEGAGADGGFMTNHTIYHGVSLPHALFLRGRIRGNHGAARQKRDHGLCGPFTGRKILSGDRLFGRKRLFDRK